MKKKLDIPSPITGGPLELCSSKETISFRGEEIPYEKKFYRCVESGAEFADEKLEKENLKRIYDTYRLRHGIPLAEELKRRRLQYGIPAKAMAVILGLGENQYRLYEDDTVPSVSVGKLLALAMEPSNMREMLMAAKGILPAKDYKRYFKAFELSTYCSVYELSDLQLPCYEDIAIAFPAEESIPTDRRKSVVKKDSYIIFATAYACC